MLGPVEYNGLTVVELQYLQTGSNAQEYHNFWTREASGVVWLPATELKGHDIIGRRLDGDSREMDRWYTENIGMVRFTDDLELVTFSGIVATEQTTWTGVKALFIQ